MNRPKTLTDLLNEKLALRARIEYCEDTDSRKDALPLYEAYADADREYHEAAARASQDYLRRRQGV